MSAAIADPNWFMQGLALQNQGNLPQAQIVFQQYLEKHPNDPFALYSLGVILLRHPNPLIAKLFVIDATQKAPDSALVWLLHATVMQKEGQLQEALNSFDRAIEIDPKNADALNNSGVLLREMLRHHEALDRFKRAIDVKPDFTHAMGNYAKVLCDFKQLEEAIGVFERLLTLEPEFEYGLGWLVYERLHLCYWQDFQKNVEEVVARLQAGKKASLSMGLMALTDQAAAHQQAARIFSADRYPLSPAPLWRGERYQHEKIKIAYLSPDLREHPVGYLMAGIMERHDRKRFEVVAVSLGIDDNSELRRRFIQGVDHFFDVRPYGARQIAEHLRAMEIDIAVDLAGYTADARFDIFTQRFAPAQVNFLGYPGTTGSAAMDYIIADAWVIPETYKHFYDEKVVYMNDHYLPAAADVRPAERTPTRAECGLPDEGLVFCSFNHDYKISPYIFEVWMRLLRNHPKSVLWLMSRNQRSEANLRQAAAQADVDPSRLVFAQRVPAVADHLARYRVADLFLDTHPYNAHTTSADALLAGLPVLTYSGQSFASRVAGSLLLNVGMPELITTSLAEYEARANHLADHPLELRALKAKLAAQRQQAPLFDPERFTRSLEAIYLSIWRQQQLDGVKDALCAGYEAPQQPVYPRRATA